MTNQSCPWSNQGNRGSEGPLVSIGMPVGLELSELQGAIAYAVEADVANLAVDRLVRGQKLEANSVHVSANPQGVQLKGDVRIAGTPLSCAQGGSIA